MRESMTVDVGRELLVYLLHMLPYTSVGPGARVKLRYSAPGKDEQSQKPQYVREYVHGNYIQSSYDGISRECYPQQPASVPAGRGAFEHLPAHHASGSAQYPPDGSTPPQ